METVANNKILVLLQIQELDEIERKYRRELQDIPDRVKELKGSLQKTRENIENLKTGIKSAQAEIHNLETEIAAVRERIGKLRLQQFQIKTNAEYKAMEKEVQAAQAEINSLENRELAKMEEAENKQKEIATLAAALSEEEGHIQHEIQLLEARGAAINEKLEELLKKRSEIAAKADPEWLVAYQRIREHVPDKAMSNATDGFCEGCRLKLPPQLVYDARRGEKIVICTFCSRMLYYLST